MYTYLRCAAAKNCSLCRNCTSRTVSLTWVFKAENLVHAAEARIPTAHATQGCARQPSSSAACNLSRHIALRGNLHSSRRHLQLGDGVQAVPVQERQVALAAAKHGKAAAAREVQGVRPQLRQPQIEHLAPRALVHLCGIANLGELNQTRAC